VVLGRGMLCCCEGKDGREGDTLRGWDIYPLVGGDVERGGETAIGRALGGECLVGD
jgi:hypothetical protein